jgi:hypothetical protein
VAPWGLPPSIWRVATLLFRSVHSRHTRWEGFPMNIVENVASGLFVALAAWGARWARLEWRRRRIARAGRRNPAAR